MALSADTVTPILSGIVGVAGMTITAGLIKAISPTVSLPQLLFSTFAAMAVVLLAVLAAKRVPIPSLADFKRQLIPAALLLATSACLTVGLAKLPITVMVALMCMTPLLVAGIEVITLRRRLDPVVICGLLAGSVGAGIIALSERMLGLPAFVVAVLAPVTAALAIALGDAGSDQMRQTAQVAFTRLMLATLGTLPLLGLGPWHATDGINTFSFLLVALFGVGGYLCLKRAAASLPAAQFAVVEQTALLWAALVGLITFGEIPSWTFWIGASLVVGGAVAVHGRIAASPA
jgi:S-adenosylmethionine uptake transporter